MLRKKQLLLQKMRNKNTKPVIKVNVSTTQKLNDNIDLQPELSKKLDITIVLSRYNENLNWINSGPYNKYFISCYNKGQNTNFDIKSPHKIINLKNVGKCDHTYLYHIINNYDNLSEYIIFLPGSCDLLYKRRKSKSLINYIEYHKQLVNLVSIAPDNIKNKFYNLKIDNYKTTHPVNVINGNNETQKSNIRPFGLWYSHHFNDIDINMYTWWGIFAITRDIIHQHPKEYYQQFLNELENSPNPEVGHYIERVWIAIFHPMDNCKFINYKFNMNK